MEPQVLVAVEANSQELPMINPNLAGMEDLLISMEQMLRDLVALVEA